MPDNEILIDSDNELLIVDVQPAESRAVALNNDGNGGSIIATLSQLSMFAGNVMQVANNQLAIQADNAAIIREFTTNRDGSENRTEISRHTAGGVRTEARRTVGTRLGRPFVRETVTVTQVRRQRQAAQQRRQANQQHQTQGRASAVNGNRN